MAIEAAQERPAFLEVVGVDVTRPLRYDHGGGGAIGRGDHSIVGGSSVYCLSRREIELYSRVNTLLYGEGHDKDRIPPAR